MNENLSKWIHNLNIKAKTVHVSEEHIHVNLCDFGLGNSFLDVTQKEQATVENIDKSDFKKCLCCKGEVRSQSIEWANIFTNRISGKSLITSI